MTTYAISAQVEIGHDCEDKIIDIPLLLEGAESSNNGIYAEWSKCCIYRVPRKLRSVNEEAYTPQIVSIGPFHHGKPKLKAMESLKSRYLDEFCGRTRKSPTDLKSVLDEQRVRACYAGNFELKSDFLDVVVTDAGFIIELLLRSSENKKDDYIFRKPWLRKSVEQDLILLENQLPFFVLERIYAFAAQPAYSNGQKSKGDCNKGQQARKCNSNCFCSCDHKEDQGHDDDDDDHQSGSKSSDSPFLKLTRNYFSTYHRDHLSYAGSLPPVHHFTDLLRYYFCPPIDQPELGDRIESLRSATKLEEAGVDFEAVKTTYLNNIYFKKGRCLRHCPCCNCSWLLNCLPCFFHRFPRLKCKQPTLKLPRFEVDDTTECLFRNLMALEQCHYPDEIYICNFVSLMDKLINTREDVDLLVDKKVIVNYLGSSKAVAQLFNKLCEQIVEQKSCYHGCVEKINQHCNSPFNRIMATLTSVYFRDFWRGTATIVGLIVMGITIWSIFLRHILKKM